MKYCSVCSKKLLKFTTVESKMDKIPAGLDRSAYIKADIAFCSYCGSYTCRQVVSKSVNYNDSVCYDASEATLRMALKMYPYSNDLLPKRLLPFVKHKYWLDFGCGAGFFTQQLHKYSSNTIGMDLDPSGTTSLQKLGISSHHGGVDDASLYNYNCLSLVGVLEHFEYPLESLHKLVNNITSPDSSILLYYPNTNSFSRYLACFSSHSWDMFLEPGHLSFPSINSIKQSLSQKGYLLKHHWTTSAVSRGKIPFAITRNADHEAALLRILMKYPLLFRLYRFYFEILDLFRIGDITCLHFYRP